MRLKKISLFIMANLVGLTLMAEGYQLNTQSARQLGMGHLGTALKLGGESMLFNPAGLSYMDGKVDLSLGATAIFSKVKFTSGNYNAETDNPIGTPLFGYAGFKITDKFYAGISVTNPAGNSLVWPDNWSGSTYIQNISLKVFSVQPTISYKFSEKLSLGVGLMADFGSMDMSKGIMPVGSIAAFLPLVPAQYQTVINNNLNVSPLSMNLTGKSGVGLGFNIGILYSPNDRLSIGLSYRSKVMMKLNNGDAAISYGSPELQTLFAMLSQSPNFPAAVKGAMMLDGGNFNAQLPIPSNTNLGIAWKATEKMLISAELQYVGWKAYDTLSIVFPNVTMNSPKNFSNTMIYRVGAEFYCTEKFTTRVGFVYDNTPSDLTLYTPDSPGSDKISITTGFTYRPLKFMDIDFAFQYNHGVKTNGKYIQNNAILFGGDYKTTAFLPSLGLRFKF
ncbi:MAG: outer membrane protein transport protein [Bacteroidales bacterium]|jgi:long-chain fatty acid transport protein|nr:outer membrane protein transport protein [Bacteroidales bacterium]